MSELARKTHVLRESEEESHAVNMLLRWLGRTIGVGWSWRGRLVHNRRVDERGIWRDAQLYAPLLHRQRPCSRREGTCRQTKQE